jgi:hypothetical protein
MQPAAAMTTSPEGRKTRPPHSGRRQLHGPPRLLTQTNPPTRATVTTIDPVPEVWFDVDTIQPGALNVPYQARPEAASVAVTGSRPSDRRPKWVSSGLLGARWTPAECTIPGPNVRAVAYIDTTGDLSYLDLPASRTRLAKFTTTTRYVQRLLINESNGDYAHQLSQSLVLMAIAP